MRESESEREREKRKMGSGGEEERRNIQAFEINYFIKTNEIPLYVLT